VKEPSPVKSNVGHGNEFHIEGFCDRNSVIAGYVYVYGNVDPGAIRPAATSDQLVRLDPPG
jgi:hypothetical protein